MTADRRWLVVVCAAPVIGTALFLGAEPAVAIVALELAAMAALLIADGGRARARRRRHAALAAQQSREDHALLVLALTESDRGRGVVTAQGPAAVGEPQHAATVFDDWPQCPQCDGLMVSMQQRAGWEWFRCLVCAHWTKRRTQQAPPLPTTTEPSSRKRRDQHC